MIKKKSGTIRARAQIASNWVDPRSQWVAIYVKNLKGQQVSTARARECEISLTVAATNSYWAWDSSLLNILLHEPYFFVFLHPIHLLTWGHLTHTHTHTLMTMPSLERLGSSKLLQSQTLTSKGETFTYIHRPMQFYLPKVTWKQTEQTEQTHTQIRMHASTCKQACRLCA